MRSTKSRRGGVCFCHTNMIAVESTKGPVLKRPRDDSVSVPLNALVNPTQAISTVPPHFIQLLGNASVTVDGYFRESFQLFNGRPKLRSKWRVVSQSADATDNQPQPTDQNISNRGNQFERSPRAPPARSGFFMPPVSADARDAELADIKYSDYHPSR